MSDEIQLNDPQTLYRRWEGSQWNPFEVDLERDRERFEHQHALGVFDAPGAGKGQSSGDVGRPAV